MIRILATMFVVLVGCSDLAVYDGPPAEDASNTDASQDAPAFVTFDTHEDASPVCTESGLACGPDQVCGRSSRVGATCCWQLTSACGSSNCTPRDDHSVFCPSTYFCCWAS
jgi:hypothetical protein